jgi:uncharacterized tellurite resistance protein B-like protein
MAVPVAAAPGAVARREDLFHDALQSPPEAIPVAAAPVESDLVLLELTVQFAFAVARADGRVSRKEKEVIHEHLERRFGGDPVRWNRARAFCARYEAAAIDLDDRLQQIAERFPAEERQALLEFARAIAQASGEMNAREAQFLERAARRLGVRLGPPEAAPQPPAAPPPGTGPEPKLAPPATPEEQRKALEIDPEVPLTAELIRRQYHLLTERYAPEKFEPAGPEFVAVARGKSAAVRAAALALLEPLGEPLDAAPPAAEPPELRHNPDLDALFGP